MMILKEKKKFIKFGFLSITVFIVLFFCFSNALDIPTTNWAGEGYIDGTYFIQTDTLSQSSINSSTPIQLNITNASNNIMTCFRANSWHSHSISTDQVNWAGVSSALACFSGSTIYIKRGEGTNNSVSVYYFNKSNPFIGDYIDSQKLTSLQCQTEYNLIPISSVDQNYCTTNNLCPSCPVCPDIPVFSGDLSELYINNILHVGAPTIIMNIPDEIDWDYAYTMGGNIMNIDIVGYNVDYEKIDSIVQFQNYKPSSEDFQKIIGLLAPYTKIIVFFVFLFIVWAWIKKPFKSKKL